MKQQEVAEDLPRAYWDPKLRGKAYRNFVRDLHQRSLLRFTREPIEFAGVFFVWKKNGRLRMIIDGRRGNGPLLP